jgi:FKBP-type peptidyl-prolyl cis-trans isomerase
MIKNKYISLLVAAGLIILGLREHDRQVEAGKIPGLTVRGNIEQNYNKVKDFVKEYKKIANLEDADEDWITELGLTVRPFGSDKSPSIISEKIADMAQTFFSTKKGQEVFERMIVTPPNTDGNIDLIAISKSPKIPYYNISKIDKKAGTGLRLECGQRVSFRYTALLQGKKPIAGADGSKLEQTRIGEFNYLPGIEYNLIGMKRGGERSVLIPPSQAYGINSRHYNESLSRKVVISSIEVVEILSPSHNFEDLVISSEGEITGDQVICGDKANVTYQLFTETGKEISSKVTKQITLGSKNIPFGLIKGLEGISKDEYRSITIPENLQNNADGERTNFFVNDKNYKGKIVVKVYKAVKIPHFH